MTCQDFLLSPQPKQAQSAELADPEGDLNRNIPNNIKTIIFTIYVKTLLLLLLLL